MLLLVEYVFLDLIKKVPYYLNQEQSVQRTQHNVPRLSGCSKELVTSFVISQA